MLRLSMAPISSSAQPTECPDCPELKAGINEQTDCDFDELVPTLL